MHRNGQTSRRPHYLGICSTCVHAPACAFRIYGGQPVWHCSEFEFPEEPDPPAHESPRESVPEVQPGDRPVPPGLCVNCEEREFCRLPRPASGVWHCEEYR